MSGEEQWSVFLAYASESQYNKLLSELKSSRGEIRMANELLQSISQDADEIASFRARRKIEMDWNHKMSVLEKAENRVRVEGRAEGRAEGLAEVAKNLLKLEMPVKDIAEATGLTNDEVEQLRTYD